MSKKTISLDKNENIRKVDLIWGINFIITSQKELLNFIGNSLKKGEKCTIFTPNPEMIVKAESDREFRNILAKNSVNIPDGKGIVMALHFLRNLSISTIRGRDLFLDICKISATNNHKIYLLGSSSSVIQKSIVRATREFPGIKIEGSEGPKLNNNATPVTKRDRLIEKDIILKIKKYNPDILFVAFGAPKQEKWIEKQKGSLPASLYMGVGGTLDYYAQVKPLPPEWMEKWGLEWLWRVINEPQRIGRIINAVFIFPILILLYSFTKEK